MVVSNSVIVRFSLVKWDTSRYVSSGSVAVTLDDGLGVRLQANVTLLATYHYLPSKEAGGSGSLYTTGMWNVVQHITIQLYIIYLL